jgi:hypothetical protein
VFFSKSESDYLKFVFAKHRGKWIKEVRLDEGDIGNSKGACFFMENPHGPHYGRPIGELMQVHVLQRIPIAKYIAFLASMALIEIIKP